MAKFDPIAGPVTLEGVYGSVIQLHGCVEDGKISNDAEFLKVRLQHQALRKGQLSFARRLKDFGNTQETLVTSVEASNTKADEAVTAAKAVEVKVDAIINAVKSVRKAFWSGVAAIIVAVIVGCIGLGFQAISNHDSTIHTFTVEHTK